MNKISSRNTPPMFSRQWEAARDEARDLDKYAPNWDGADANSVPLELIRATLQLFRHLEERAFPAPDLVYPAADGTVYIEWHHENGFVQMLNMQPDRIRGVVMGPDGKIIPPPLVIVVDEPTPGRQSVPSDCDPFEFALAS